MASADLAAAEAVLVRRVCGLGDLVLSIPWLRALRHLHGGAPIHVLCHGEHARLLLELGLADAAFPEEGSGWHSLHHGSVPHPPVPLRPDPLSYRRVYLFCADPQGALPSCLKASMGDKVVVLPARPAQSHPEHAAMLPFRVMGLETGPCELSRLASISFPENQDGLQRGLEHPLFVIHPGSGSPLKNWPPQRFSALMRTICAMWPRSRLALIAGPADQAPVKGLLDSWSGQLPVLSPPTLTALVRELGRASLLVGNDSGVTHLAASLGVPTLAIFGPSDPIIWAPLGPRTRVALGTAACGPCHGTPEALACQVPCHRFPSVEEAWEELQALMEWPQ